MKQVNPRNLHPTLVGKCFWPTKVGYKINIEIPIHKCSTLLLLFLFLNCLSAEPFLRNQQNEPLYRNLETLAEISGEKKLWEETIKQTPTRLDLAVFLNDCLITCEQKNIELHDELISLLLKEFDRELLVLDIQNRLEKQDRYLRKISQFVNWNAEFSIAVEQLSGDFPITERELTFYGSPPPSSVLSFSQQVRLNLTAGTKNNFGFLRLKNFGFWGIGKYSSGATGINFSSSDPPNVEEILFQLKSKNLSATIGKRYLRLGEYGLSIDYLVTPLESIQFSYYWKKITAALIIGSRADSADYYATRIGIGPFGLLGFLSAIKKDYTELYNLTNDKGLGCDLGFHFWGDRRISGEYSYYQPDKEKNINSWFAGVDLLKTEKVGLTCRYADIGAIPRQSPALNQLPLEFIVPKFVRHESNSQGPELFFDILLPYSISGNYEFLYSEKSVESESTIISKKHIVRVRSSRPSTVGFILANCYTIENHFKYNTIRAQLTVKF